VEHGNIHLETHAFERSIGLVLSLRRNVTHAKISGLTSFWE
jgi:hypothetical protein